MTHISIEGMDGVGKTTTCDLLAVKLGYIFVEKNLKELFDEDGGLENYKKIRNQVNETSDRLFTSWFYSLSNIYLHTKYQNNNIITDRYILSNYAWSGVLENREVYELLVSKLKFPDLTIILYANEKVLQERLKKRNLCDSDLGKVNKAEEKYEKMVEFCNMYNMPYVKIDSSEISLEETVDIAMNHIQNALYGTSENDLYIRTAER